MRPRDNPFRVERLRALPYELPEGESWVGILERLDELTAAQGVAVVLGPEGRGKSTLVRELARRLAARGETVRTVTLRRGQRRLAAEQWDVLDRAVGVGVGDEDGDGDRVWWCVDGIEQVGAWHRSRLRRLAQARGARLLVTGHGPLGHPLSFASGSRWPILIRCETSPELLERLVGRLLGERDGVPLPPAEDLHHRHDGNLALALLEAYDRCAAV